MNAKLRGTLATLILLGLPIAQFIQDGTVSDTLIGGLLILACGGGGFAADKALKARVRKWAEDGSDDDA